MRFTQFGHQVPRKNSRTIGPRSRRFESENCPSRFAAVSENSGARDPIPNVSVRFCTLKLTVRYPREQNKGGCGKRTSGGTASGRVAPTLLPANPEKKKADDFATQPPSSNRRGIKRRQNGPKVSLPFRAGGIRWLALNREELW